MTVKEAHKKNDGIIKKYVYNFLFESITVLEQGNRNSSSLSLMCVCRAGALLAHMTSLLRKILQVKEFTSHPFYFRPPSNMEYQYTQVAI